MHKSTGIGGTGFPANLLNRINLKCIKQNIIYGKDGGQAFKKADNMAFSSKGTARDIW